MLALEILNILAEFEPPPGAAFGAEGWTDAAWLHLQLEAAKLVYADRDAMLTDPAFRDVPVELLLSREHARRRSPRRIDPRRADPPPPGAHAGGRDDLPRRGGRARAMP